jgi:hypothetical protein
MGEVLGWVYCDERSWGVGVDVFRAIGNGLFAEVLEVVLSNEMGGDLTVKVHAVVASRFGMNASIFLQVG